MSQTITLSSNALIRIFGVFDDFPSDDTSGGSYGPFGPFGPGAPVLGERPPQLAGHAVRGFGPQPDPWRFAALGRQTAEYVVRLHDFANASGAKDATQDSIRLVQSIDDDVCGNDLRWIFARFFQHRIPHQPVPPDPPIISADPIEITTFGVQFLVMGKLLGDTELAASFTRAGEHMATTGLEAAGKT